MTAVLIARVHAFGGADAVARLLRLAGSERSPEYLADITNWIAYDEAVALWTAGALVTHHPQFARAVGEDTARRLSGSQVSAALRSLGSPEKVYRAIATSAGEFSTVTKLSIIDAGPGFADVVATAADGYRRSPEHCAWTSGLLTCGPVLFGLAAARVEHVECQADGRTAVRLSGPLGDRARVGRRLSRADRRAPAPARRDEGAPAQRIRRRVRPDRGRRPRRRAGPDHGPRRARGAGGSLPPGGEGRAAGRAALPPQGVRGRGRRRVRRRAPAPRGPRLIRTRGWSYRSARTGASTAGWSRSAAPARASWPRSASCSRCTRTTPRPRSTARRR